jgi:hypothetical protein
VRFADSLEEKQRKMRKKEHLPLRQSAGGIYKPVAAVRKPPIAAGLPAGQFRV